MRAQQEISRTITYTIILIIVTVIIFLLVYMLYNGSLPYFGELISEGEGFTP